MTQLVVRRRAARQVLVAEPLFEPGPQLPAAQGRGAADAGEMVLVEAEDGGARPLRELGSPKVARDVVEALLADRGVERGFRPARRGRGERGRGDAPATTAGRAAT